MLSKSISSTRARLRDILTAGGTLDHTTFMYLVLWLIHVESEVLRLEALVAPAKPEAAPPPNNVIPFPLRNNPRVSP